MTIQEAIQSGKPFKLPHHKAYTYVKVVGEKKFFFNEESNTSVGFFSVDMILSSDWVVKQEEERVNNVLKVDFGKRKKV